MRRQSEVSPRVAAEWLGVHRETVRRWARETASGGAASPLTYARVDASRLVPRYYVDGDEIARLARREPGDYF